MLKMELRLNMVFIYDIESLDEKCKP